MDNTVVIGKGEFVVSRFFNSDKSINQVVKEKILKEINNTNVLTSKDKKSYNK